MIRSGKVINNNTNNEFYMIRSRKASNNNTNSDTTLRDTLRMLWEAHIFWTRLAILSIVFDLPDADVVTNKLLSNPGDFANLLTPYIGKNNATMFDKLLTSHLVIASQLVKAAKAGDSAAAADYVKQWYANADEIARFLSSVNPKWSESKWKNMLYEHLADTKSEAVNMLQKNYQASINDFASIEPEALEMAEYMYQGLK